MTDIAIGVIGTPIGPSKSRKPSYLISLVIPDKRSKESKFFISLDKPISFNGFIEVKGIFVDSSLSEEHIIENFSSILTNADKGLFSEMMIPWHRICSVRNLIFRAK